MRIVTLNTWGGRAGKELLLEFFGRHAESTDIFCLQEVWSDAYQAFEGRYAGGKPLDNQKTMTRGLQEISSVLSGHGGYFRPHLLENYGLCTFVRKGLPVIEEGEVFVHHEKGYVPEGDIGNHARNLQYVTITTPSGPITIINFHGLWNGKGKTDCNERIAQSEKMIEFLRTLNYPYILCGDFNLRPDTESLAMLEREGLRNLVREYRIESTRTSLYDKVDPFADYILVREGVEVVDFQKLPDVVSDHAPLLVEVKL